MSKEKCAEPKLSYYQNIWKFYHSSLYGLMASASKINKKMQISLDKLFGEIRQVTQALRKMEQIKKCVF